LKSGFRSNDLPSGYQHLHFAAAAKAAESDRALAVDKVSDVTLCSIVIYELRHGAESSTDPTREHAKLDVFLAPFSSLPFDDACAAKCAAIRRALERKGERIGPHDLQIAAIALQHDLTLVTHNTREFNRIPSLRLQDWES
jgi:tRNA(fMet)-specific endonuclease VapC